jgi:molecular chaperone DnaJ
MHLKDYYQLLQLEPPATLPEIKKAYRRLAQQYHPDKNNNDPYAAVQFVEIKEAYEVLSNPGKKEYYLQQRWYNQSTGKRKTRHIITPVTILLQALELEKYVSTLDIFRMDKEGLKQYILGLLPDSTIDQLKRFNETDTNGEIIATIIKVMNPLPLLFTKPITAQLQKLSADDEKAGQLLSFFIQKKEKKNQREKYSLIVIIIVTLIICLLIYLAGH